MTGEQIEHVTDTAVAAVHAASGQRPTRESVKAAVERRLLYGVPEMDYPHTLSYLRAPAVAHAERLAAPADPKEWDALSGVQQLLEHIVTALVLAYQLWLKGRSSAPAA